MKNDAFNTLMFSIAVFSPLANVNLALGIGAGSWTLPYIIIIGTRREAHVRTSRCRIEQLAQICATLFAILLNVVIEFPRYNTQGTVT